MPTVSLATLLVQESKETIYRFALGVGQAIGLNVSSWQPGDPTRSLFHIESELLSSLEALVAGYISSGFLDYASGTWLKILAEQVYGVTVPPATYASCDVVLTNAGGGIYDLEVGDVTLKNSLTGKTYRNTTSGLLGGLSTLTVTVVADEAGSESSAGAGEIDELVTSLLGVTCSNALAAVGSDEQEESTTRQQCRDKLGSLSPNGPREAYSYVALTPELTGTSAISRVRVYANSETGDVRVILAGPGGAIVEADRALVEAAILQWATPLCITPTIESATAVTVDIAYELWVYKRAGKTAAELEADVETALETLFKTRPIGGDLLDGEASGKLYRSLLESTIESSNDQAFRVELATPAVDVSLANEEVAALGTVTATTHLVVSP